MTANRHLPLWFLDSNSHKKRVTLSNIQRSQEVLWEHFNISLTFTRPDKPFAVNQVCQFMHDPRELHLQAAKRILRYVKGRLADGLLFPTVKRQPNLVAYSDADWGGDPDSRRSISGFCVFFAVLCLCWHILIGISHIGNSRQSQHLTRQALHLGFCNHTRRKAILNSLRCVAVSHGTVTTSKTSEERRGDNFF